MGPFERGFLWGAVFWLALTAFIVALLVFTGRAHASDCLSRDDIDGYARYSRHMKNHKGEKCWYEANHRHHKHVASRPATVTPKPLPPPVQSAPVVGPLIATLLLPLLDNGFSAQFKPSGDYAVGYLIGCQPISYYLRGCRLVDQDTPKVHYPNLK